jgi:SAM-dependent methyltransferase
MSRWYKILYQIGFTPWEEDAAENTAAEQLATLFHREERGRRPPFGRALDLGCGSGIWSVTLATRGWDVTGIDIVPKAIRRARARAEAAGVPIAFVEGDVTAIRSFGIVPAFRFILDIECFNHLSEAQRAAVGREVTALAEPAATLLMLVWKPGRRGPLPPGASRADIELAFPDWTVIDEDAYAAVATLPAPLKHIDPRFYRLRLRQ